MKTIIPTASAVNRILIVDAYNRAGTLRLIFDTVTDETVTIMQPAVYVDGETITALDPDNPAHWADTKFDGDGFILNADNIARGFPYRGTWLVKKSAGTAANEFGVEYV